MMMMMTMMTSKIMKNNYITCVSKNYHSQRGIALVLVLWVLMLLTVLAFEFSIMTRTEAKTTLNQRNSTEAYYYARAGIYKAIAELSRPILTQNENDDAAPTNNDILNENAVLETPWLADGRPYRVTLSNGSAEIKIFDEGGKININQANRATLHKLFSNMRHDRGIAGMVDPILDWRDKDNIYNRNGAEDPYYLSLPEPYHAKNSFFDTIDELLWVKGITSNIFYTQNENEGRLRRTGLVDVLTASLDVPSLQTSSSDEDELDEDELDEDEIVQFKVNVNTAPQEVLVSIPGIDTQHARGIIAEREYFTFNSPEEIEPFVRDIDDAIPFISFRPSGVYTVDSYGTIASSPIQHHIRAIISITPKEHTILQWNDSVHTMAKE